MDWLSASEALELLGTQPQTLYANVSRGRITARPDPADSRKSLYRGEDVRRLAQRAAGRRKQATIAVDAMRFGEPVMQTSISTIAQGRLLYRGRDAVNLADTMSLEEIAALLWGSDPVTCDLSHVAQTPGFEAAFVALARRAASDVPTFGRSGAVLKIEAASVLSTIASGFTRSVAGSLHERLAATWERPRAADAIRRALVLLADHELNASTFATRVAVSTGASLAAGTLAGLSALTGPLHGGAAASAQALALEAETLGAEAAVVARLAQGQSIPAFGHPLYPDGDARAAALLSIFEPAEPFAALQEVTERITGEKPNIDFALVAMAASFGLPKEAPLVLFAMARTVGWLAHAMEQVATGQLMRPRAEYVGLGAGDAT
ncbi:citrate synthase [Devosia epidermidihirudinis]|uniref:Citrate synthase n=1 Tax=Devosia epidermidihirudinis TaxID=1293439 RepID=A0A0F5QCQ0_9HYPH|nr:citrate synthase [Devosia epidermidihirudinis]KKC38720.1 citrate synthase [Devosia epidermidihirudinis]